MATLDQIASFLNSIYTLWTKHSGRFVTKEQLQARLDICSTCDHFTGRGCRICKCCVNKTKQLFNKLAYPNEECPDGKWLKIENPAPQK